MLENTVIIIVSQEDIAGMNMLDYFLENHQFMQEEITVPQSWPKGQYKYYKSTDISILVIPEPQIFTDYLRGYIQAKLLVFASKHSSAAGQKALLVHTTGIWQEERGHGGNDFEIGYAPANLLAYAYERIKFHHQQSDIDYWTGIECTHHGPSALDIPIAYFETGGTIDQWKDTTACHLVAKVMLETIDAFLNNEIFEKPALIGIGGNHYCSRFIKILDTGDYSLGHVIPKYALGDLPNYMLDQAYEKTLAQEKIFLVDKKGARAADRDRVIEYLEQQGYGWQYA